MKNRLILADLVIIYARFGNSQPPVSLEIATIASLIRETLVIILKSYWKKKKPYFMRIFAATKASLVFFGTDKMIGLFAINYFIVFIVLLNIYCSYYYFMLTLIIILLLLQYLYFQNIESMSYLFFIIIFPEQSFSSWNHRGKAISFIFFSWYLCENVTLFIIYFIYLFIYY